MFNILFSTCHSHKGSNQTRVTELGHGFAITIAVIGEQDTLTLMISTRNKHKEAPDFYRPHDLEGVIRIIADYVPFRLGPLRES